MLIFPVIAIGLTMLGFTFLGDGLRDALDPEGSRGDADVPRDVWMLTRG